MTRPRSWSGWSGRSSIAAASRWSRPCTTPASGRGQVDRIVFVGGPTRMPVVRAFFEELFGRKAEMGVDPMECVACGAAVQAGVLGGEMGQIVLVDVTPLTLGVETLGGIATP